MKVILITTFISLVIQSGTAESRKPSEKKVMKGVRRAVMFEVTPNESGGLENCKVIEIINNKTGLVDQEFQVSGKFVTDACENMLSHDGNWIPKTDELGNIIPLKEKCLWSKVIPDSPICRAELSFDFAEQIPNGVGLSVIFSFIADGSGAIISCKFTGMYDLSGNKMESKEPHALYIEDGCRKLRSISWNNQNEDPDKPIFYFCRYIKEVPARAFCEQKFGK